MEEEDRPERTDTHNEPSSPPPPTCDAHWVRLRGSPVPVYVSVDADALVLPPPHIHHQVRHLRPHSRKVKQPCVLKATTTKRAVFLTPAKNARRKSDTDYASGLGSRVHANEKKCAVRETKVVLLLSLFSGSILVRGEGATQPPTATRLPPSTIVNNRWWPSRQGWLSYG